MIDGQPGRINRTDIDGVPVFWPETPLPGQRFAALMFRVGRGHEPVAMGGITHLVEHLALAPLAQQDYQHNGFVAGWRTAFHAAGTEDELVDYLARVTSTLGSLPLDRLAMERRILRQEGHHRDHGIVARLLWYRFGNDGFGTLGTDEPGLQWLGPGHVEAWARERFIRQNVVAWFSGPPPTGLRFTLPDGDPSSDVPLRPLPDLTFPTHLGWRADGISIGYLVERSAAALVALRGAVHRARDQLRFERGLVYEVHWDYEPLDGMMAHGYLGADCRTEDTGAVRDALLATLEEVARDGLRPDDIRREVRQHRDSLLHPQAMLGQLDFAATNHLLRLAQEDTAALLAEYDAITPETTASAMRRAFETLLVAAPQAPTGTRSYSRYPMWSRQFVDGRTIRPAGWPLRNYRRADRLTVGDDGVTWADGRGGWLTVRYADCVTYLHWDGDRRELRGRDGFAIRFAAEDWSGGRAVVRRIDAAVPPAVVACGEHGVGGMEDPPAQASVATRV